MPEFFDETRPAFVYSHVAHDSGIAQHPTGRRLPRATTKPTIFSDPEDFAPLLRRWDAPRYLDDYLYTDAPQLSLHVVSFTDATIVSLSWPHTFLDAMGRRALLDAWVAVLEGRDEDVKPLYGVFEDPLESLGTNPQEPYVLAKRRLSPIKAWFFAVFYIWATMFWHRGEETRMIYLPAAHVKALHKEALDYLATQSDDDGEKPKEENKVQPFLSEGDVLSAWISRLAMSHLRHANHVISIINAFGLRSVLAKDLLPPTHAYVGNAVACVCAFLPMSDLFNKPLGYIASAVRRSITEQGTRAQIEARAAIDLAASKKGKISVFGDPTMIPIMISNWTKGKFFETDFSAAVVARPGDGTEEKRDSKEIGRPSYIQPNGLTNGVPIRNSFPIVGKDAKGNYWLSGTLRVGLWDRVQELLDEEFNRFALREPKVAA